MRKYSVFALGMMLVFLLCSCSWGDVPIDAAHFPDPVFRAGVAGHDWDKDGVLSEREIELLTSFYLFESDGIATSLKGVEYLTALTNLHIDDMQLTELDLSKNTALTDLWCNDNKLTRLDLSKNTALTDLWCNGNQLTTLDFSKNTAIMTVHCSDNQITSINVKGCKFLKDLWCYNNQLTTLDISDCQALMTLYCSRNSLSKLDLSHNPELRWLDCGRNELEGLDLSSNTKLVDLNIYNCQLTSLNLRNNTALKILNCHYNKLTTLDLRYNTSLVELDCENNQLTDLDLSHNTTLVKVNCKGLLSDVRLKTLNVSGCSSLVELDCSSNELTELDLSTCTSLANLDCGSNRELTMLILTGCTKLVMLDLKYCRSLTFGKAMLVGYCPNLTVAICDDETAPLVSLLGSFRVNRSVEVNSTNFPDKLFREYVSENFDEDSDGSLSPEEISGASYIRSYFSAFATPSSDEVFSSLKGLEYLVAVTNITCSRNNISEIDLSKCPLLESLWLNDNNISTLDLSGCVALDYLNVEGNSITDLDVSNHPMLEHFYCSNNPLKRLNADNCSMLDFLSCSDGELASLSVKNCTELEGLLCPNNQLTELDLSTNPKLDTLYCWGNQLTKLDVSNSAVTNVGVTRNPITQLIAKNCPYLRELWCYDTPLEDLDISECPSLEVLSVYKNQLSQLNVSGNTTLHTLNCWDNLLTTIDVSKCTSLRGLFCSGNQIESLDLTANAKLRELSCARNNIKTLDLSKNKALTSLFCYDNKLRSLNISENSSLLELACSDNSIINLDLSNASSLTSIDCSSNYLAELDLSANKSLVTVVCRYTTLRGINVSGLTKLETLNVERGSLTTLDAADCTALTNFTFDGNKYEGLNLTKTNDASHPYQTNLSLYASENLSKVSNVKAFNKADESVTASFSQSDGIVRFAAMPVKITYDYDTGRPDALMTITVSLPTRSMIYLPKVEPSVYGIDEYMHEPKVTTTTDSTTNKTTATVEYAAHYVGHSTLYDVKLGADYVQGETTPDYILPDDTSESEGGNTTPDNTNTQPVPPADDQDDQNTQDAPSAPQDSDEAPISGSSGGGCASGFGLMAMLPLLAFMRKKNVFCILALLAVSSVACAEVKTSDYTLPIPLEDYTPSGTWSTNFQLTSEIVNTVADVFGVTSDRVRNYSEIAMSGTWEVSPADLDNLARNGEYGGIVLPLTPNGTGSNYYVVLCTFGTDVQPGEHISAQGFEVDTDTRESVYSADHSFSGIKWVTLDDSFNRVETVPENRRIYLAVSLSPEYINTGILTVRRGEYVVEDDPTQRLDDDIAKLIAEDLGIPVDKLQYISRASLGAPQAPTQAMKDYVGSDDREIILNMPTVSVDVGYEGMYFNYTLPDDIWEEVKGKDVSDYPIYALNDTVASASGTVRSSGIITGMISLWEVSGGRLNKFGPKEILIGGLLQVGQPFSLYLTKLILALLLGGCSNGINPSVIPVVILAVLILELRRR